MFGATDSERKGRVGRVAREVAILSSLDHPHVVKYHEAFELDAHLYIVMELVHGETLAARLDAKQSAGGQSPSGMAESDIWRVCSTTILSSKSNQMSS